MLYGFRKTPPALQKEGLAARWRERTEEFQRRQSQPPPRSGTTGWQYERGRRGLTAEVPSLGFAWLPGEDSYRIHGGLDRNRQWTFSQTPIDITDTYNPLSIIKGFSEWKECGGLMLRLPESLHTKLVRGSGEETAKTGKRVSPNDPSCSKSGSRPA